MLLANALLRLFVGDIGFSVLGGRFCIGCGLSLPAMLNDHAPATSLEVFFDRNAVITAVVHAREFLFHS
jgi:hypothetical protein